MKKIWLSVFLTLFLPLALAAYDYPSDLEGSNALLESRYSGVRPYIRADAGLTYSSF